MDADERQLSLQKESHNASPSVASLILIASVDRHSSSRLLLMHCLLMVDPVPSVVILDLVERCGNGMKESADNSQNKRTPRKITRVIMRIGCCTRHVTRTAIAQTRRVVAMSRASKTTIGPGENSDSDKGTDEQHIQQHPDPAKCATAGIGALLDAAEKATDESVEDRCSEDAFDGPVGAIDATARLNRVDEAVHFVEALGEDTERDERGEELQDANRTEEHAVEGSSLESFGNEAREQAGLLTLVVAWTVHGPIDGLAGCM